VPERERKVNRKVVNSQEVDEHRWISIINLLMVCTRLAEMRGISEIVPCHRSGVEKTECKLEREPGGRQPALFRRIHTLV
jgi:hypothetical protein